MQSVERLSVRMLASRRRRLGRWSAWGLAVLAGAWLGAQPAQADACKSGCKQDHAACVSSAAKALGSCLSACSASGGAGDLRGCFRQCRSTWASDNVTCNANRDACLGSCTGAPSNFECSIACTKALPGCIQAAKDQGKLCTTDCRTTYRQERLACRAQPTENLGQCFRAAGSTFSSCMKGCSSLRKDQIDACDQDKALCQAACTAP